MNENNKNISTCTTCEFSWRTGTSGIHDCIPHLEKTIQKFKTAFRKIQDIIIYDMDGEDTEKILKIVSEVL